MKQENDCFQLLRKQRDHIFQEGVRLINQNKFSQAEQKFATITKSIEDVQSLFQQARCFRSMKNFQAAISIYKKIQLLLPDDPRPIYQQGLVLECLNKPREAAEQFANAISVCETSGLTDPIYSIMYFSLGCKYIEDQKVGDALEAFNKCVNFQYPATKSKALQEISKIQQQTSTQFTCSYKTSQEKLQLDESFSKLKQTVHIRQSSYELNIRSQINKHSTETPLFKPLQQGQLVFSLSKNRQQDGSDSNDSFSAKKSVFDSQQKPVILDHEKFSLIPKYEGGEESSQFDDNLDAPDEKEGEMMKNKQNFDNTHSIKSFQTKLISELQNSRSYYHNSGIFLSSQSKASNEESSFIKKEFDHPEKSQKFYSQKRKLGEGSFGSVSEVIYLIDGNSYALKMIPNKSISGQQEINGEIEIMKQLNHNNVIKIYNAFKTDDQQSYCIISELADNGNLKEYITKQQGRIDKSEILNMMKQMITALHYLHSKRIIHRDIKPGNIFLSGKNLQIKIGDFGIAKKLMNKVFQQSLNASGTEKYFSPEYKDKGFSMSSDIWSMGIVFLELLGVQVNDVINEDVKKSYFKKIPPQMTEIIAGMLQISPSSRYSSLQILEYLQQMK